VGLLAWSAYVLALAVPSGEFVFQFQNNLSAIPGYMLTFGLVCGLSGAFTQAARPAPARWLRPHRKDLAHQLVKGLKAGLVYVVPFGALTIVVTEAVNIASLVGDWSLYDFLILALWVLAIGLIPSLIVGAAAGLTASFS
jgi:hypothetical protein